MENAKDILMNYAGRFRDHKAGQTAVSYAQERGWVDENGEPTPDGKKAAAALKDQLNTRSAFRIG